jgi:hypothetical protein
MTSSIVFNKKNYQETLKSNKYNFLGSFPPFIRVNRESYHSLREKTGLPDFHHLDPRLSESLASDIRCAVGFTLRNARTYFPAYKFFVNEYLNDEWLATVDWHKKFHRDHVIHQAMSVYVGLGLLKEFEIPNGFGREPSNNKKTLIEYCFKSIHSSQCNYLKEYLREMGGSEIYLDGSKESEILWENLFLESFFLATLFHDMGYPWSFVQSINKKLDLHFPDGDPSNKDAKWITKHYSSRLLFYPFYGYKKPDQTVPFQWSKKISSLVDECLKETHGISGAISLLYLNDALRIYPDVGHDYPERRFCIEWAAMAVMMHDMAKIYAKVDDKMQLQIRNPQLQLSIDRDPLSFILTLTDQIQDFGRPNATFHRDYEEDNEENANVTYASKCSGVELTTDESNSLTITYRYKNHWDYFQNKEKFLKENKKLYFDSENGYIKYYSLGISDVDLVAELDDISETKSR